METGAFVLQKSMMLAAVYNALICTSQVSYRLSSDTVHSLDLFE
jgi:hypothetical protein